jgi:hypothetical protein
MKGENSRGSKRPAVPVSEKTTAPVSADSSCLGRHRGVPCKLQEHEGVYHRLPGGGKVERPRRNIPSSVESSTERSPPATST